MSELRVNRIVNAAGSGAPQFPSGFSLPTGMGITGGANITGTAATFSGAVNVDDTTDSTSVTTGALIVDGGLGVAKNVYIGAGLSVAGTLTYQDVTEVDAVGLITAQSGINITGGSFTQTGGGELKVGTGVTIASTSGVSTFNSTVTFANPADGGKYAEWVPASDKFQLQDSTNLSIGSGDDLKIYHSGSHSYIDNTGTGNLYIRSGTDNAVWCEADGAVKLYWDNSDRYETTGAGSTSVGISTVQDFSAVGMLKERVEIVANKLSAGTNVDLAKGNVWYYSTNETTTATPNFRYDGTDTLNNKMLIGDTLTAVIISKPNGAGYYAACTVDGGAITEEWLGGAAPAAASAGGYDVTTHTLTKTANATFICLSNVSNYA